MSKENIDRTRRRLLGAAGGGLLLSAAGSLAPTRSQALDIYPHLRWGFVGTGLIANSMANVLKAVDFGTLVAVSSRRMETANTFADRYGVEHRFDSWAEMCASDVVDAIYVATPTSVREEICIEAAANGKHVLGEKPFASAESVRRIAATCRKNGVGFMDGTHFVHHPRTADIKSRTGELVGWPWSLDSAFQFNQPDRNNIRYNRELEPMGAIGDAGWYNMRAAVEYLSPGIEAESVSAYLRRDKQTGAAISGSGTILFNDGSTTTWNCGFDSGAVIQDIRLTGGKGVITLDNFLSQDRDGSASYTHKSGGWGRGKAETIRVESELPGAALMFADFAYMVSDEAWRDRSIAATENTQRWLDAIWESALENE